MGLINLHGTHLRPTMRLCLLKTGRNDMVCDEQTPHWQFSRPVTKLQQEWVDDTGTYRVWRDVDVVELDGRTST